MSRWTRRALSLFAAAGLALPTDASATMVPALEGGQQARVESLLGDLKAAELAASEDPKAGLVALERTLREFEDAARLVSRSSQANDERTFATLTVAEHLLLAGLEDEAQRLVDAIIRNSHGGDVPVHTYGEALRTLLADRIVAPELAPVGQLSVTCGVACRVVLDEKTVGEGRQAYVSDLAAGEHRLFISARDEAVPPLLERFEVTLSDSTRDVAFAMDLARPPRRLPRWAGIAGVAVGAVVLAVGVALIAIDGRCPDGTDPDGPDACDDVFDTLTSGAVLTAAGGATLAAFSIALSIGEVRHRRRGDDTTAMLNFTHRF